MEIGIDSFAILLPDAGSGRLQTADERLAGLLEEVETADRVGLDVFGVGEHHRAEFLDSAPVVILAAAAARTRQIRLTSAVSVLSAADPVRLFQQFATLDLLAKGRAEIVVGRGSFAEAYPLFGLNLADYDALFVEKLDLLLKLRDETYPRWSGRFRPALTRQGVFPRPLQSKLPIWLGVGGTPESFVRAGTLGLPLMLAIIGGTFARFRPLVDLYRQAWRRAGHAPADMKVGIHAMGFVAEKDSVARDIFYDAWAKMFDEIGRERRVNTSRAQFDAMCAPGGAFLVGDPDVVAKKVVAASDTLGGVDRMTFQMSAVLDLPTMLKSITLLGNGVAPAVRAGVARVMGAADV